MEVTKTFQLYLKREGYRLNVYQDLMLIEVGRDKSKTIINKHKSEGGKLNKSFITKLVNHLQTTLVCSEQDARYFFLMSLTRKNYTSFTKGMGWTDLEWLVGRSHDYFDTLYTEKFSWQRRTGKGAVDTRQPSGLFGYIGDEYRVSENGVVQSNKGDTYWSNMSGTVGTKKNNIHFSHVEGLRDLFMTREELVAAFFMDDESRSNRYLHYVDESKGPTASNLVFKDEPKGSKGTTRQDIYLTRGYLITKIKGKEADIHKIEAQVTRKQTDEWLRKLKGTFKTSVQDYLIVKWEGRVSMMTLEYYRNMPPGTKKEIILKVKDLVNDRGSLSLNQANFNHLINKQLAS